MHAVGFELHYAIPIRKKYGNHVQFATLLCLPASDRWPPLELMYAYGALRVTELERRTANKGPLAPPSVG